MLISYNFGQLIPGHSKKISLDILTKVLIHYHRMYTQAYTGPKQTLWHCTGVHSANSIS